MDSDLAKWLRDVRSRLRAARLALELTHRAAGERTGVPFQTITRIETGKTVPTIEVIYRLAVGYEADLCFILCGTEPAKRNGRKP